MLVSKLKHLARPCSNSVISLHTHLRRLLLNDYSWGGITIKPCNFLFMFKKGLHYIKISILPNQIIADCLVS